jgi:hypothetical protein
VHLSGEWRTSFRVHREYSGNERLTARSLVYRSRTGLLRKLTVGNFTARMGMGSVIGYRGKLFDYSDRLNVESLTYPDYGGFNGVHAVASSGPFEWQGVGSYTRDDRHALWTVASSVFYRRGMFRPGLVLSMNRLTRRESVAKAEDFKAAINADYRYRNGYSSFELTGQTGQGRSSTAIVAEGRHRFEAAEIRYAVWAYGEAFLDLSGGSKAGNLSRKIELKDVDFSVTSRRSGQEGLLMKTVVVPSEGWTLTNSTVYSALNADTTRIELLASVGRDLSSSVSFRGDYLVRRKKTVGDNGIRYDDHRRTRLEVRLKSSHLRVRSYIAYAENDSDEGYFSFFSSARLVTTLLGSIEVWSNLGRIRKGVVEYWYFFVEHELDVSETVAMGTKLSNAYRYRGTSQNDPVLSLELRVRW